MTWARRARVGEAAPSLCAYSTMYTVAEAVADRKAPQKSRAATEVLSKRRIQGFKKGKETRTCKAIGCREETTKRSEEKKERTVRVKCRDAVRLRRRQPVVGSKPKVAAARAESTKRTRRDRETTHDEPVSKMTLYEIGGVPAAIEP